jgi:hypothetical protein
MTWTALTRRPRATVVVAAIVLAVVVWAAAESLTGSSDPGTGSGAVATAGEPTATTAAPGAEPSSGPEGTPSPGSLDAVPAGETRTKPPVPMTATADFGTGVTIRVTGVEAVAGVARGPGQIAGPAVRLDLEVVNDSRSTVSLESMVLAVSYGSARTPAMALTGPGGVLFEGELEAGGTARGRYVFAIPVEQRHNVQVTASYAAAVPAVEFTGTVR